MATLTGLFTLGRDAELRSTSNGDHVATINLAYNYGRKTPDGKQPTQWVRASLWGKRAESLAQYLTKGKQIHATLEDVNVREFDGTNGKGFSLEARIADLEFTRGQSQSQGGYGDSAPPQRQAAAPSAAPAPQRQAGGGFDDMDDDIPF